MMTDWQDFDDILASLQMDDAPAGGTLIIIKDGKQIVNTSVGNARPDMAWSDRTLSVNFSIGKGVMATLIAVLVSRGLMSYDLPICHYWAEFGTNGKEFITPRHVLTHTSGLFDVSILTQDASELTNWQIMTHKVSQMSPHTPKGQEIHDYASAYSALVSGWILGALVEKITGLPLQKALDTYLAEPLGLAGELYWGLPDDKLDKVAKPLRYFNDDSTKRKPTLKPDTPNILQTLGNLPSAPLWQSALKDLPLSTANINKLYFDTSKMNLANYKNALMPNGKDGLSYHDRQVLQAVIPAANGVSTAHALATIYTMHANDGAYQGQTLIDPDTLADMRQIRVDGFDAVMPANMRWRSGFHRLFSLQNTPNAYGHMGYNGSIAFADPDRKLAFAFIHNFDTTMLNDVRQFALFELAIGLA
ncbi:MAG: serine hydrolase domain-containing protein [Moraxella sp.]|uniref:serine hydrolase domain-containing protein n=1 Tax=Moraxella sp. TaxID=479 RepID=UPI0026DC35F4|nr:serine hydrolase domain-containing protein [Moraxella sp.]MDO4451042.1 serine hydrolase domain-containing protein [Moraxella sp.]